MGIKHEVPQGTEEQVVKRIVYLAWERSQVIGMGVLQDKGSMPEDEVWRKVGRGGDSFGNVRPNHVYCDYVFGRMMKLMVRWGEGYVELPSDEEKPTHPEYQSWCGRYPTYQSLFDAAVESLKTAPV